MARSMTGFRGTRFSKIVAAVACVALVVGLLPAPALADPQETPAEPTPGAAAEVAPEASAAPDAPSTTVDDPTTPDPNNAPAQPAATTAPTVAPASSVLPETDSYYLWVGDAQVTSDNTSGTCGSGTWSYSGDATGGTLTLTNATITNKHEYASGLFANIYAQDMNLTVTLVGESTLDGSGSDKSWNIFSKSGSLTLNGGGSLTATSKHGIEANRGLTIQGECSVSATGTAHTALGSNDGDIVIKDGSHIVAKGNVCGVDAINGAVKIEDSNVDVSSDGSYGINCHGITISRSSVKVSTKQTYGIYSSTDIAFSNSFIEVSAGNVGIFAQDALSITCGTVTCKNGTQALLAYGGISLIGAEIAEPEGGSLSSDGTTIVDSNGTTATNAKIVTKKLTVSASANPSERGAVSGGGIYEYGTDATLTATPNEGYHFTGWTEDGTVVSTNTSYVFAVTSDRTLVANFEEMYTCDENSGSGSTWTKGSPDPLTFRFKRAVDNESTLKYFRGIEVDGKAVPEKDSSGKPNWTASEGSVILSLQPSFLETLGTGDHTVKALFSDGESQAAFSVKAAPAANSDSASGKSGLPDTSDKLPVAPFAATALLSLAAILVSRAKLQPAHAAHRGKHAR